MAHSAQKIIANGCQQTPPTRYAVRKVCIRASLSIGEKSSLFDPPHIDVCTQMSFSDGKLKLARTRKNAKGYVKTWP